MRKASPPAADTPPVSGPPCVMDRFAFSPITLPSIHGAQWGPPQAAIPPRSINQFPCGFAAHLPLYPLKRQAGILGRAAGQCELPLVRTFRRHAAHHRALLLVLQREHIARRRYFALELDRRLPRLRDFPRKL